MIHVVADKTKKRWEPICGRALPALGNDRVVELDDFEALEEYSLTEEDRKCWECKAVVG